MLTTTLGCDIIQPTVVKHQLKGYAVKKHFCKGMMIMNKSERNAMIIFIVLVAAALLYAFALGEGILELPDFITNKGYFMYF